MTLAVDWAVKRHTNKSIHCQIKVEENQDQKQIFKVFQKLGVA